MENGGLQRLALLVLLQKPLLLLLRLAVHLLSVARPVAPWGRLFASPGQAGGWRMDEVQSQTAASAPRA